MQHSCVTVYFSLRVRRIEGSEALRRSVPEYNKDDFTAPVEDYDFSTVEDVISLIDQIGRAGGFTATKLAHARAVLSDAMVKSGQEGVLNWLSLPACLCATGTRGFFPEALKRKTFTVIITTCGTLAHDIARTYQDYFHRDYTPADSPHS